jgi:NAD(P)-dependent dehydrogenase (short-subunit alcohol dehydrogenase family)
VRRPVALVTGGTRGIGLGIARALAERGWDLEVCGLRAAAEVAGALEALRAAGAGVQYERADVSSTVDRRALVDGIGRRHGALDALVNNAGRGPRARVDLLEAGEPSFDDVLGTNLRGPYFLTQAVARQMLDTRPDETGHRRSIVFVTSVSAEMASPHRGDYCVSKAGLSMAARLFATRLAADGIAVFEVRPGIIDTDMTAPVRTHYDDRIRAGLVPAGRWGTAADVASVVAALVTGDVAYATGSVVNVDGGLLLPRL